MQSHRPPIDRRSFLTRLLGAAAVVASGNLAHAVASSVLEEVDCDPERRITYVDYGQLYKAPIEQFPQEGNWYVMRNGDIFVALNRIAYVA
jgi:hypothetical protein